MAPSRGYATQNFLCLCVTMLFIKDGLAGLGGSKQVTEYNMVDENEVWDPTRPLPRSKALVYSYLRMHEVVPDIIPTAPKSAVEVVYANSICVDFGNELTPNQINVIPHRTVWPVEKDARYTLILFSPDYPSRSNPTEGDYLCWLIANIFDTCVTATGTTFTEYATPIAAANETGLHRYIFLVFKQPEEIMHYHLPHIPAKDFDESRKHFNASKFAKIWDLGAPVAANLFQMAAVHREAAKKKKYR